MGIEKMFWQEFRKLKVSIQLISPTSGDTPQTHWGNVNFPAVSIQLISPTSGDLSPLIFKAKGILGFHSINIPNEWGFPQPTKKLKVLAIPSFHSINIPNEWGS